LRLRNATRSTEEVLVTHRLMVFGLTEDMREEDLYDLFDSYGTIVEVEIPRDPLSGRPLGYGYVRYAEATFADHALSAMNGASVAGQTLRVRSIPKSPEPLRL
jgi:RNA recognition motif-containing protein